MAACISPISIKDPLGTTNAVRLTVPCGKCYNCYANRRADWTLRLNQELKVAETANFITLTYNDKNNPIQLEKKHIQDFLKRLRYKVDSYYTELSEQLATPIKTSPIRYFIVGEYGPQSLRPHYHGIFFNLPKNPEKWICSSWQKEKQDIGFVHIGTVNQASIHYTTKYILDALTDTNNFSDLKDSEGNWIVQKPFSLMSRKPGIGQEYVKNNKSYHRDHQAPYYTHPGGVKQRLPRYYKDKMFSEKEKKNHAADAIKEADKKDKESRQIRIRKGLDETYPYQQYENTKKNIIKKSKNRLL